MSREPQLGAYGRDVDSEDRPSFHLIKDRVHARVLVGSGEWRSLEGAHDVLVPHATPGLAGPTRGRGLFRAGILSGHELTIGGASHKQSHNDERCFHAREHDTLTGAGEYAAA